MSKNNKPNKQTDKDKEKELQQIEEWLEELPDFNEKNCTSSSYEDVLSHIKKKKSADEHIDNRSIIDEVTELLLCENALEHIETLFAILKDYDADSSDYSLIGMSAYEVKNYIVAERAYRMAIEQCTEAYLMTGYKNNLAYLIRRKEIENPDKRNEKEVPLLLRDGASKKDTFSLINMALFWALERGDEDNWDLADKLVSCVDGNDVERALGWWKGVALADEAEGYLVHLLLVRHGKVASSPVGSIVELFDRVKKDYPGIPDKMKEIVTPFNGGEFDKFPTFPPVDWD
ncbi:hypothetical protein [Butyrivibrio fibrisolvens]|uniref:Uncharacterized protein n=1 Tax=Butyrivibrio fibrisolvens TaxID=831 RepID=A0A317G437_BUTFI|nr:hypothetical protein [Butyrivibrio fibrisolvens]PWT28805.1 hypothetical protein CPT75_17655 [Butyrivibrio fibrisolvens]